MFCPIQTWITGKKVDCSSLCAWSVEVEDTQMLIDGAYHTMKSQQCAVSVLAENLPDTNVKLVKRGPNPAEDLKRLERLSAEVQRLKQERQKAEEVQP